MSDFNKISPLETGEELFGCHHRNGAGLKVSGVPGEDDPGTAGDRGSELQSVLEVPHPKIEGGEGVTPAGFSDFDPGEKVGNEVECDLRRLRSGSSNVVAVGETVPGDPALVISFAASGDAFIAGLRPGVR